MAIPRFDAHACSTNCLASCPSFTNSMTEIEDAPAGYYFPRSFLDNRRPPTLRACDGLPAV